MAPFSKKQCSGDFFTAAPTLAEMPLPAVGAHLCRNMAQGVSTSHQTSTGSSGCPSTHSQARTEIPPAAQRCIHLSWDWFPSRVGYPAWDTAPLRNTSTRVPMDWVRREEQETFTGRCFPIAVACRPKELARQPVNAGRHL